ncbi:MAG: SpoIID/LytB domain-containing protein [bacterium]
MITPVFHKKLSFRFFRLALLSVILAIAIFTFFGRYLDIYATDLSSGQIQQQIDQKQKELNDLNNSIKKAQADLKSLQSSANVEQSQASTLNNQLAQIDAETKLNTSKIEGLNLELSLKSLELQNLNKQKNDRIKGVYKMNKTDSKITQILNNFGDIGVMFRRFKYLNELVLKDNDFLAKLDTEIKGINLSQAEVNSKIQDLNTQNTSLTAQKVEVENKLAALNSQISQTAKKQSTLTGQVAGVQTLISQLTDAQKQALQRESTQLESSGNNSCSGNAKYDPLVSGEFYFQGKGRDLYDGHAIGMSQFGAYGAALQGMSYSKILTSYYSSTVVGGDYSSYKIRVSGRGEMDIETYVSGLGEIPSYACETPQNKGKPYVVKDNGNIWNCWPEESIKAQVVAARSYALAYIINNPGYTSVPTDTTFQVYNGGTTKRWAADATKGQAVLYNNNPISAYYSSNARGHTENNELVWTARSVSTSSIDSLKGSPLPYARGVSEDWTLKTACTNFNWRTNSLSYDKLSEILSRDSSIDVGKITSIQFTPGSSPRIWAVTATGDKGTKYIAGWKFKAVYNDWVYNTYPSDKRAFLFSTEFTFNKAP